MTNVVEFSELGPEDTVVIETASRSVYAWTKSEEAFGVLDAGVKGRFAGTVAFGSIDSEQKAWASGLRVGVQAVFLVPNFEGYDGYHRITTSTVVRLAVKRAVADPRMPELVTA